MRFASNNTEAMRIDSSGNLGIGTDSPTDTLHVGVGNIRIGGSTGNNYIYSTSSNLFGIQVNTGPLVFLRNNGSNESMRIDSSGNVGIGTDSPDARLKIVGDNTASGITLRLDGGGTQTQRGIVFAVDSNDYGFINIPAGGGGAMSFGTGTAGAAAERLRITSSGNVGIGTDSPNADLHIGSANATGNTTNPALQIGSTTTYRLGMYTSAEGGVIENKNGDDGIQFRVKTAGEAMRIDGGTGNVGIGTTSPAFENGNGLEIRNSSGNGAHLKLTDNASGTGATQGFDLYMFNSQAYIENYENAPTIFRNNGGERMRISSSGQVSIGTTSTTAPLRVKVATDANFAVQNTSSTVQLQGINDAANAFATIDIAGNPIKFSANGSESMRIDARGAIGFGTTPPSDTHTGWNQLFIGQKGSLISENATGTHGLDGMFITDNIYMDSDTGSFANIETNQSSAYRQEAGEHIWYSQASGSAGAAVTLSEKMRIDTSGNVGIGTTSPLYPLHVDRGATGDIAHFEGQGSVHLRIGEASNTMYLNANNGNAAIAFRSNDSEKMRITNTGTLLVSTTTTSGLSNGTTNYGHSFGGGQQVNATNNDTNIILNMSNGSSNPHVQFRSDGGNTGNISTNGSAVSYNASSDYRLKENVIPLKDGLDRLNKLNPVQFDWKKSQETDEGFIAHEVQEIVPYVVKGEKDGEKIQTMDYGKLTPLLVKAIQEQQTQIEALQSEINELKNS
jgi:hypothetical protein